MSTDTHAMRRGGVGQSDRTDRAREAVRNFRALQPTLTAYARALTGNRKVRVEMSSTDNGSTDGERIFFRPPIELGDRTPHVRRLCNKRGDDLQLLCKACAIREHVLVTIYHEIAHILFETFAPVDEWAKVQAIKVAVEAMGDHFAQAIDKRVKRHNYATSSYLGLSSLISEYLQPIVNALEDARVNSALFETRQGTRIMFDADTHAIFNEGVEQVDHRTGETIVKMWKDYPLNSQAIIGVFCRAAGYTTDKYLDPFVVQALDDPELNRILDRMKTAKSARDTYELSFPVLVRLRELGFCKTDTDPEPPPPEEEKNDQQEEQSPDNVEGGSEEPPDSDSASGAEGDDESSGDGDDSPESGPGQDAGDSGEGGPESDDSDSEEDSSTSSPAEDQLGESKEGSADRDGEQESEGDDQGDASEAGDESGDSDSESGAGEGDQDRSEQGSDDSAGDTGQGGDGERAGGDAEDSSADAGQPQDSSVPEGDDVDGSSGGQQQAVQDPDAATEPGSSGGVGDVDGHEEGGSPDDSVPGAGESGGRDQRGDLPENDLLEESQLPGTGDGLEQLDDGDKPDLGTVGDDGEQSGEAGSSPDVPAVDSDASGSESAESGVEAEPVDTGADRGEGGAKLEAPEGADFGTADETMDGLLKVQQHTDPPKTAQYEEDKKAVDVAIVQGLYFETPSVKIAGVVENHHGKPSSDGMRNAWELSENMSRNAKIQRGIDGDFDPSESVLGPALQKMRRVFTDNKRGHDQRHLKAGRVNGKVLGKRAPVADPRLFKKRTQPGKRDYLVVIGVDISGSQIGENIVLTKRAVMAQANLLARMGISFSIYAHTGQSNEDGMQLDVYHVKDADDPWSDAVKERLRTISGLGVNLDGHAMEYLRKKAEKSTATDTIILYYSDGKMPAANFNEELEILQREIGICKKKDITLLGVGIRTDSPAQHGLDTVQVDDDEDIMSVVLHLEKRLIA